MVVRIMCGQKPNLFTVGNASIIACFVCLVASGAKVAFEQVYFVAVEQWASSDPFFSQYWLELPNFKRNIVSALLDVPILCSGSVIATCTVLRMTQKNERSNSLFEWFTIVIPALWIVVWFLTLLVYWLPIRWLTQSGTHW